ncbi:hypothetical protein ACA910_008056 [Epithemia clementina (nom. ined.)]
MSLAVVRGLTAPIKITTAVARVIKAHYQTVMRRGEMGLSKRRANEDNTFIHLSKRQHTVEGSTPSPVFGPDPTQGWAWATQQQMKNFEGPKNLEITTSTATKSVVKHDKADVPVHLWDDRVAFILSLDAITPKHQNAFNLLQQAMLNRWRRNVIGSWKHWWCKYQTAIQQNKPSYHKLIRRRGITACGHACNAHFWGWPQGLAVFFWQWPEEFMREVAIGVEPMWTTMPK